jgi:hypothetical protein
MTHEVQEVDYALEIKKLLSEFGEDPTPEELDARVASLVKLGPAFLVADGIDKSAYSALVFSCDLFLETDPKDKEGALKELSQKESKKRLMDALFNSERVPASPEKETESRKGESSLNHIEAMVAKQIALAMKEFSPPKGSSKELDDVFGFLDGTGLSSADKAMGEMSKAATDALVGHGGLATKNPASVLKPILKVPVSLNPKVPYAPPLSLPPDLSKVMNALGSIDEESWRYPDFLRSAFNRHPTLRAMADATSWNKHQHRREAVTLAVAMDLIRTREVERGLEVLVRRYMALQMADDANWEVAQYLESPQTRKVSTVPPRFMKNAYRMAALAKKAKGGESDSDSEEGEKKKRNRKKRYG